MNLVTPKGAAKCDHLVNKPAYCLSTLRFQMWFDADVLDVQIELQCRYFGILSWLLFWLLFTKLGTFFNLLVALFYDAPS